MNNGQASVEDQSNSRPRVRELSHVIVHSRDLNAWKKFATVVLGMGVQESGSGLRLKMDDTPFRFVIEPGDEDRVAVVAWRANGLAELSQIAQNLRDCGRETTLLSRTTRSGLAIEAGISFSDDQGIVHEVFVANEEIGGAFHSKNVTGYVTDDAGLGHIVFIDSVARCDEIFLGSFGMSLREDITTKVGGKGHFYGCNPRHHSAAAVDGSPRSVMHIMLEMKTVDDVGCALDRALAGGWSPRTGLGRHRTDHMFSFYIPSPSGFDFELGCGGLRVEDDDNWEAMKESSRLRVWGHAGIKSATGKDSG
jgi:2,3-dihydroxybiphenyl 1,2-dioxygenase